MLTWKLWRGLRKPSAQHPLFQRLLNAPAQIMPWYVTCAIILVAPFFLLPGIVFMSAVYGLRWSVVIAGAIARERESGMYELIALSPTGSFGLSRAIMSAYLHQNESLAQIQSVGAWVMRLSIGLVLMLALTMLSTPIIQTNVDPILGSVITPVYLATFALAIYLDHVQSIVLSELVGMLIPVYTHRRGEAGIGAGVAYAVLQVATYMLTLLLGFVILDPVMDALPIAPQARTLILPFLRLLIFYAIREAIIQVVWRILVHETNAAASEIEFIASR